jgi:4-aminobutyrate aminotransferase/(S)-3-amino-2-methylpropionate transaminase
MRLTSFSDEEILRSSQYFLPCVRRWFADEPILFVEGKGAVLKDSRGKEYLDLHASHGCATLLGYGHPAVIEAIKEQVGQLYGLSVEFPTRPAVALAELLTQATPESLNRVYFANAGAEAVEVALFLAKKHTGRSELVALYGAFHGRSHGARSLLGWHSLKKGMGPYLPGVARAPSFYCYRCQLGLEYPACDVQCARMVEDVLLYATEGEVAVFVAEPVQGTAGNIPAPDGYFQVLKEILDRHGILLFIDEIFTSWGSTGKKFCHEHYDVVPDMLTMSKTLGNGLPISALLTREDISQSFAPPAPTLYFTTFGSNPLMAAAALASVKTILKEKPWERAAKLGEKWMAGLGELQEKYEIIGDVRGKGVMIGVELVRDRKTKEPATDESKRLIREAGERGLILPAGMGWFGSTIRMNPPVVMTEGQVDQALDILDGVLAEIC